MSRNVSPKIKTVIDIAPVVIFFACFKLFGIFVATAVLMGLSVLSATYLYYIEKKIPWVPVITALFVLLLGGMTLFFHDDTFVKLKLTFINGVFAAILMIGYMRGKGLLKYLLGQSMQMSDAGWRIFSLRWGLFFLSLALLNEVIWRNFSTQVWVNYKVFGILGLTFIFLLSQTSFIKAHVQEDK